MLGRVVIFFSTLLLLVGCSFRSPMINALNFDNLEMGTSWNKVQGLVGKPVEIIELKKGSFKAIYLQRITEGSYTGQQMAWKYTLEFKKNILVSKEMKSIEIQESLPDASNF